MPFLCNREEIYGKQVMSTTSVARWAMVANAARRRKRATIGAAVKTVVSEQRAKGQFWEPQTGTE